MPWTVLEDAYRGRFLSRPLDTFIRHFCKTLEGRILEEEALDLHEFNKQINMPILDITSLARKRHILLMFACWFRIKYRL